MHNILDRVAYYCLTVPEVYGEGNILIPEGYKMIAFRPPKKGESCLISAEGAVLVVTNDTALPRIIVEKKAKPLPHITPHCYTTTLTVKDIYDVDLLEIKIPEYVELTGEFRPPKCGDLYINASSFSTSQVCTLAYAENAPRLIVRQIS